MLLDLSRTLLLNFYDTYAFMSDRICRAEWKLHSLDLYLVIGEAREAFWTPTTGSAGLKILISLSLDYLSEASKGARRIT